MSFMGISGFNKSSSSSSYILEFFHEQNEVEYKQDVKK